MGLEIKGPPAVKPISPLQSNALEQEQQQQQPTKPTRSLLGTHWKLELVGRGMRSSLRLARQKNPLNSLSMKMTGP